MRIQHNIAALNSYRNLTTNNSAVSKNLEKLSSGYKINRAGDDAAGLAISEKMRAQITGLETAQKNANDGISLVQTAEGALTEVHSMLNRMVELADQSANGTYDDETDRANLQKEFEALTSEIDRISKATNFNGIQLLDGSMKGPAAAAALAGGGITANPTATTTATTTAVGVYEIDLSAVTTGAVTTGGNLSVKIGSGSVDVIVEAGDDGTAIAEKIAAAANGKLDDGVNGKYTVTAAAGVLTVTASAVGAAAALNAGSFTVTAQAGTGTGKDLTLQIGDTSDDFNKMTVSIGAMDSKTLGLDVISIGNQADAAAAVDVIKNAINMVSSTRGDLGAIQNRLEHTINNLSVTTENMTSAESRIRDVDMAEEMMAYTKNNILVQSSQAMLAQANQIPQGVLQLLQ